MSHSSEIYNSQFYQNQKNGSLRAAKIFVPFILALFPHINRVCDIGCGSGAWLSVFAQFGKEIFGFDFGSGAQDNLFIAPEFFQKADISKTLEFPAAFDLALSLEVAEHLPPPENTYLQNLACAAHLILFSAAIPGQAGVNHVNCQWPSYWAKKFSEYGFIAFDILRPLFWTNVSIPFWYRQNILLFVKYDSPCLDNCKHFQNFHCLPLVHPELIGKKI